MNAFATSGRCLRVALKAGEPIGPIHVQAAGPLRGQIRVPGDKSISHRALIFNAFADGKAELSGLLDAADVHATADCLRALGIHIDGNSIIGGGSRFKAPAGRLDCGNSGTTIRLLLGALAGQAFTATLTGDASLSKRPMDRVTRPLSALGARFSGSSTPPVTVSGGALHNCAIRSPIASAQVKTALLLAGLQGKGTLLFHEPALSRDHSERLLSAMGIQMSRTLDDTGQHRIEMEGGQIPQALDIEVPGDISSAAFFLVAGSIVAGSDIVIENVGLNPTRTGALDALERMGAEIEVDQTTEVGGEPVGRLRVRSSKLVGTVIEGAEIPRLIDEIPILAVAAACAQGTTTIRNASELRVKESDRIEATVSFLRSAGVEVQATADGMVIHGAGAQLNGFTTDSHHDHRIAMAAWVAGLVAKGETTVTGGAAIRTSFPSFPKLLGHLYA